MEVTFKNIASIFWQIHSISECRRRGRLQALCWVLRPGPQQAPGSGEGLAGLACGHSLCLTLNVPPNLNLV